MNIFIIHSGTDKENAKNKEIAINKINETSDGYKKANVLLLDYKTIWKPQAKKLIQSAQIVLYILSADGHKSKNIDWEIRQAKKYHKAIVILNEGNYTMNKPLYENDPFTTRPTLIGKEIKALEELFEIIESYEDGKHIHLFNTDNMEPAMLFEQYKMFSDTSESLVARRQNVNSFYISANTALITIAVAIFSISDSLILRLIMTMVLTLPGILLNSSWLKVMESYALINSSKMKILGMLEKKLSASLFDAEWEAMSSKYNKNRYVSFSDRERNLPIIFRGLFICVDIICGMILLYQFFA